MRSLVTTRCAMKTADFAQMSAMILNREELARHAYLKGLDMAYLIANKVRQTPDDEAMHIRFEITKAISEAQQP